MFEEFREFKKEMPKERDEFDELIDEIRKEEKFGIKKNSSKSDLKENIDTEYLNNVEVVLNLFTIDKGIIKVLLLKKQDEPYKGHLMLPNKILKHGENVQKAIDSIVYFDLKLDDIYIKQSCFMSNIMTKNDNSIVLSYIGIINVETLKQQINKEIQYDLFPINDLPKIVYGYDIVIEKTKLDLKEILIKLNNIKLIFSKTFSISELQNIYEQIFNDKFDRRNFRKKFVRAGIVEETGDINEQTNGRPAKLYRFKENSEDITLF